MSRKMKVLAQRKFAQGAQVLHSQSVTIEKKKEVKKDNLSIHVNNMTAFALLDTVSFQNIHKHKPVVVLEKLNQVQKGPSRLTAPPALEPSPKLNKDIIKSKKRKIKQLKQRKENTPKFLDNLPLKRRKSLRNKSIKNTPPKTSLRKSVSRKLSTSPQKDDEKYAKKQKPSLENKVLDHKSKDKDTKQKHANVTSVKEKEKKSPGPKVVIHKLENKESSTNHKNATIVKGKSKFKKNKVKKNLVKSDVIDTLAVRKALPTRSTVNNEVINIDKPLYNEEGIKNWVNSTQTKETLKEPASVAPKKRRQCSPSVFCASVSLKTVRDIVNAPETTLNDICKNCEHCYRVNKLRKISKIMRTGSSGKKNNIYDVGNAFDGNKEANSSTEKDKLKDNVLYLDLLPENSPHVIEITEAKVPNQEKNMMRARLVPKSLVNSNNEFSIVEHENILDQLLNSLSVQRSHVVATQSSTTEETLIKKGSTSKEKEVKNEKITPVEFKLDDAPTFYPNEIEFKDPIKYIKSISEKASKFGLCKIVPPDAFSPSCNLKDDIEFTVTNQYIARMYKRWNASSREMCAIKAHLASQSVQFKRAPLLDGTEVNLTKLYSLVQKYGGLKDVIEKKRWTKVAEDMRFTKGPNPEKKLDQIYVKYLLPYETLSSRERQRVILSVEKCWTSKAQRMLDRASNPLHRQKKLLGESSSSGSEADEEEVANALAEAEDCVLQGRPMKLTGFKKIASNIMKTYFDSEMPSATEVETTYWKHVLLGSDHVCVNTASIDTGEEGFGFTKGENDPFGKHPWNLKVLSENKENTLRSLGRVLGVTVPTLHLGMVFSTSCWHRDPHGLPWVEYMHSGPPKIWYSVPDYQDEKFRKAVDNLCPSYCQNKSLWLPSDIAMIPPNLLVDNNVFISRVQQKPGEFIVVFPMAYSSSMCTGYTVSESVYFGTDDWLNKVYTTFQEVRESCEPTMFSVEELLLSALRQDIGSPLVLDGLLNIVSDEINNRKILYQKGVKAIPKAQFKRKKNDTSSIRDARECDYCRATVYLSKVIGIPDKKSTVCAQHAVKLMESPKYQQIDVTSLKLIISTSETELKDTIKNIKKRQETKIN